MQKILMLETRKGTEDGYVVRQFHKGDVVEVKDCLADHFIAEGYAVNFVNY